MIYRFSGLLSLALTTVVLRTKTATVYATPTAARSIGGTESSNESTAQERVARELQTQETVTPTFFLTIVNDPLTTVPTFSSPPQTVVPTLPFTPVPTTVTMVPTFPGSVSMVPQTVVPTRLVPTIVPTVIDTFPTTIVPTVIDTSPKTIVPTTIDTFPTTIVPTDPDTPAPSVICTDDPDFRINGDEEKDCEYVIKNNKEVRCTRPGALEACRATCDPACYSSSPSSSPTSQPIPSASPSSSSTIDCTDDPDYRVNGKKKQSCEWVAKRNTRKRCDLGGKVEEEQANFFCRLTCNPACEPPPAPTAAPTFKPSIEPPCKDIEEFVINGVVRNCKWTGKFDNVRCKRTTESGIKVSDACPSVCDSRCTCTNTKKIFPFENKKRTCRLILKRNGDCLKNAGRKKIVADFCPRKCDDCYPEELRPKKKTKKKKRKKGRKKSRIII